MPQAEWKARYQSEATPGADRADGGEHEAKNAPAGDADDALDEALDESFPASDPPSMTDPARG